MNVPVEDLPKEYECPILYECMRDPVIAADGHTYERAAIQHWFNQKRTSPVTNKPLTDVTLRPNYSLRSLITNWRESQQDKAGKLDTHLQKVTWASTSEETCGKVEQLRAYVEREEMVVSYAKLRKARKQLETDEDVWCDAVGQALDELEEQCRVVVSIKRDHLRKAEQAVRCAEQITSQMEFNVGFMQKQVDAMKKQLENKENELENKEDELKKAQKGLGTMKSVTEMYQNKATMLEVELAQFEEEDAARRGNGGKRKREVERDEIELDGRSLFEEASKLLGHEWSDGATAVAGAQARVLMYMAAKYKFAGAQYWLGSCYERGCWGVKKDMNKAVKWFTKAAEQGYVNAQHTLGFCYLNGTGVELDNCKAVKWFTKAAEQGYVRAQAGLGCCYRLGRGVERDNSKAVE